MTIHKQPNSARWAVTLALLVVMAGCASTPERRSSGEALDDASVSSRIKAALLADRTTDGTDIEIEVDRGRVQLNGFADSTAERDQAEAIAKKTSGVKSVVNNLEVAEGSRSVGRYIDDKVLLSRVKTALVKHPDVSALAIEVEVNRGVVQLGGFVDSEAARTAAGEAADAVRGVSKVRNNLMVR